MLRLISAFVILVLFSVVKAQPLFDPPEGFSEISTPDVPEPPLRAVEKFSAAHGLVQITVVTYPRITNQKNAREYVRGIVAGMKNNGLSNVHISETEVRGYQCKKIEGVFHFDSEEDTYKTTALILFSTNETYLMTLSIHDLAQFEPSIEELAERLNIAGTPTTQKNNSIQSSKSFQVGEKIGRISGIVIIIAAIILIVRRITRKEGKST